MNPETWKLIVSIGTVLVTVVTGPLIWALRSEGKLIRAEFKLALTETEKRLNERIDTRLVHRL